MSSDRRRNQEKERYQPVWTILSPLFSCPEAWSSFASQIYSGTAMHLHHNHIINCDEFLINWWISLLAGCLLYAIHYTLPILLASAFSTVIHSPLRIRLAISTIKRVFDLVAWPCPSTPLLAPSIHITSRILLDSLVSLNGASIQSSLGCPSSLLIFWV